MNLDTAFNINGGAGRVLCSIPAFELYEQENPDDNFIIVVDYGIEFFMAHPTLYRRCYEQSHKNLFTDLIEDMNYVSLNTLTLRTVSWVSEYLQEIQPIKLN